MNPLTILLPLLLSPLLLGVINKTKALLAGRKGPRWFQVYYDLARLLGKGTVYSQTSSWVLRLTPAVGLACLSVALLLIPAAGFSSALPFSGDLLLLTGLLALCRYSTILAALDTGSSFEGMGASREAFFSCLTEPILLIVLLGLSHVASSNSLNEMLRFPSQAWGTDGAALVFWAVALFILLLTENSRVPVDDPNTHLELTMIHEVMILDYSGPDLAYVEYTASLKLWVFASVLTQVLLPNRLEGLGGALSFLAGVALIGVAVGLVESVMARVKLDRVPALLMGAAIMAVLGLIQVLKVGL